MNRLRLTRPAAERLLALAGVRTPWLVAPPTRTATRLGPVIAPDRSEAPDDELTRLRALTTAGVHPDLVIALGVLERPRVLVEVDLAARRPEGDARLHSWQRWAGGGVVALSTAGCDVELAWHAHSEWGAELARVPAAVPCRSPGPVGGPVTVPQQLLVATGAALRAGRGDLADALVDGTGLSPATLRRLHDCRARLRVLVTGATRVRWVGWVLLADGWRELEATPDGVGVRLVPTTPLLLGARVERLVDGVLP